MAAFLAKLASSVPAPGSLSQQIVPKNVDVKRGNPLLRYFVAGVKKIKELTFSINDVLKEASAVILALVVLGVCVMLVVSVYVYVYIVRPRPFMISHSAPFEKYMTDAAEEISMIMHRLSTSLGDEKMSAVFDMTHEDLNDMSSCGLIQDKTPGESSLKKVADLVTSQLTILTSRTMLTLDVVRYFQYHRSLASMTSPSTPNMLARLDFKGDAYFLSDVTGEVDVLKVEEFYTNVYVPITKLREAITKVSLIINSACGLVFSSDISIVVLDIHLLRLHLDAYHDQITLSYETRKTGAGRLPTAIMTLYWWPEVEPTYTKSVPNLWKEAPQEFKEGLATYQNSWDSLGEAIKKLPSDMAHVTVSDGFTDDSRTDYSKTKTMKKTKGDGRNQVIEGFSIGGLISGLLNIINMIGPMFKLLQNFIQDPFGTIIEFLGMMLGLVIGLVLYLIYMLLTITQVYWVPGVFYAFCVSYVYAFILSAFEIAFTLLLALPYGVLALLDMVTGGMVMHMLRCESLPSDWANVPFLAFENSRKRIAGVCASPCSGERFAPSLGGAVCSCLSSDVPPFCPQQQLYRAFRELPLGTPWISEGFIPDSTFYTLDQPGQQQQMALAYQRKTNFLGRCYAATSPYSFVTRHLCSDLDNLLPKDTSKEVRQQLTALCGQVHCQFASPLGDDPSSHVDDLSTAPDAVMLSKRPTIALCNVQPSEYNDAPTEKVTARLGQAILLVTLASCMSLVILYSLLG